MRCVVAPRGTVRGRGGGPAIDPQPIGIAIRKDDAGMKEAVAAAVDAVYVDGTMRSIVENWSMTDAVELLQ